MDNNQYIEALTQNLKNSIKLNIETGTDKTIHEYLDRALIDLKQMYKSERNWRAFSVWSFESREEIIYIWNEIRPALTDVIEKYIKEYKHKKMAKEIKIATARAVIRAAMQDAGLKHHFVGQAYRARVSVQMPNARALTFYLPYKKVNETIDDIIKSLKTIRQNIEILGPNVTVDKTYQNITWI